MKPFGFTFMAIGLQTTLLLPANVQLHVSDSSEIQAPRADVIEIDHQARVLHAEELLGKRAAETAGITSDDVAESMEKYILDTVRNSLRDAEKDRASEVARAILSEANAHQMDPMFVMAIVSQESQFRIRARGRHGEIGLMQIKPATAEWIANRARIPWMGSSSLFDPAVNIRLGVAYFAFLRDSFSRRPAAYVAAYNMGPLAVRRRLAENIVPYIYAGGVLGKYRSIYRRLQAVASGADRKTQEVALREDSFVPNMGQLSN